MLLRPAIQDGDRVIDATAGNGHDTVFLAECVGPNGKVIAFDIQAEAIRAASARIEACGYTQRVDFHHSSHEKMGDHAASGSIAAVMFNLGYLPGGDHGISTVSQETLNAIGKSIDLLRPGGVLSIVCYPGHPQGAVEATDVESLLVDLTTIGWRLAKYSLPGTKRPAPFLLLATKPGETIAGSQPLTSGSP